MSCNNYYFASRNWEPKYPSLSGNLKTQVCVLGGGIAGISTALELRLRGYEVCLLEAETIGSGASGQNGGQAIVDVACGVYKLANLIGWEKAKKIFLLSLEGLELIKERIEQYEIDCGLTMGNLTVAQKKRQDRDLIDYARIYEQCGYQVELWNKEKTRNQIDSDLYTSALYDPKGMHFHPLNYTVGLSRVLLQLGGKIYEHSPAIKYEEYKKSGSVKVFTPSAQISCTQLVICVNVGIENGLNFHLANRIMPVGTYIAATKPLGSDWAQRLIRNQAGICDMNFALDYFRCSPDTRLLFGGRVSYSGIDPTNLKKSLYKRLIRVYPEFKLYAPEEIFEYSWGGRVDITMNRAPHFGQLSKQIYFLQGFSGHGLALTNIAGKIVAEAIAGNPEKLSWFQTIPHHRFWGGKHLRKPLLVLGMLYFRMKDFF